MVVAWNLLICQQELLSYQRDKEWHLRKMANMNLYHVTKFSHYLSFVIHYFYPKNKYFYVIFIHKNCFELFL